MFFVYLRRELRRRRRQAILIALGLALGVGLVITVTAASAGVQAAQGTVLHSLYGVGTDVTVTQTAGGSSGKPARVQIRQQIRGSLGSGSAGTSFSRNLLISSGSGLGTLDSTSAASIGRLPHVAAAAGALALTDLDVSGTIPPPGSSRSAKTSISTDSFSVLGVDTAAGTVGPLTSSRLTTGRTFTAADAHASVALVDAGYAAQHKLTPGAALAVGSGQGDPTTFTVVGVVQAPPGAVPASVYIPLARAQSLGAAPQGSGNLSGKVNTIYVTAASAADIGSVQHEIATLLPHATVITSSDLASQVSGSLASTATLAGSLGSWLEALVLAASFGLASLLTMGAVARRVREFGTLKALGWRSSRIVAQVMGETITMGLAGGLAGTGLGFTGAALVARLAPPLSATVGPAAGSAAPHGAGAGIAASLKASAAHTVTVGLTTPVTAGVIAAAVLLALAGGLIAGGFGGWRAARLRPAAALARVE